MLQFHGEIKCLDKSISLKKIPFYDHVSHYFIGAWESHILHHFRDVVTDPLRTKANNHICNYGKHKFHSNMFDFKFHYIVNKRFNIC